MLHRVEAALPADIAIFAAAVADWRVANAGEQKLKKTAAGMPPLQLVENPDILATISKLQDNRPPLVIGFAAETQDPLQHGRAKLTRKGADAIVLNDVSREGLGFDSDNNAATFLTEQTAIDLPEMTKRQLADRILDETMSLRRPQVILDEGLSILAAGAARERSPLAPRN